MTIKYPTCSHFGYLIKHARYKRTFRLPDSAVTVGGILATDKAGSASMVVTNPFWKNINTIGSAAIGFMCPMLAGYIAYSITGRPGDVHISM